MKHPDFTAFSQARNVADKRSAAIAAFEAASEAPEYADWRGVAEILRAVVPTPKKKAAPGSTWVDDPMPRAIKGKLQVPKPVLMVRFSDGRAVWATALTVAGKPVNWGRGVRQAIEFYRGRVVKYCGGLADMKDRGRHVDVPEIETINLVGSNDTFDAAEANRMTEELRAGSFNLQKTIRHAHMAGYQNSDEFDAHVRTMYLWGTPGWQELDGQSTPTNLPIEETGHERRERRNVIRGRFMRSTSIAGAEEYKLIEAVLAA